MRERHFVGTRFDPYRGDVCLLHVRPPAPPPPQKQQQQVVVAYTAGPENKNKKPGQNRVHLTAGSCCLKLNQLSTYCSVELLPTHRPGADFTGKCRVRSALSGLAVDVEDCLKRPTPDAAGELS